MNVVAAAAARRIPILICMQQVFRFFFFLFRLSIDERNLFTDTNTRTSTFLLNRWVFLGGTHRIPNWIEWRAEDGASVKRSHTNFAIFKFHNFNSEMNESFWLYGRHQSRPRDPHQTNKQMRYEYEFTCLLFIYYYYFFVSIRCQRIKWNLQINRTYQTHTGHCSLSNAQAQSALDIDTYWNRGVWMCVWVWPPIDEKKCDVMSVNESMESNRKIWNRNLYKEWLEIIIISQR